MKNDSGLWKCKARNREASFTYPTAGRDLCSLGGFALALASSRSSLPRQRRHPRCIVLFVPGDQSLAVRRERDAIGDHLLEVGIEDFLAAADLEDAQAAALAARSHRLHGG